MRVIGKTTLAARWPLSFRPPLSILSHAPALPALIEDRFVIAPAVKQCIRQDGHEREIGGVVHQLGKGGDGGDGTGEGNVGKRAGAIFEPG
jgi:hypothetical protein